MILWVILQRSYETLRRVQAIEDSPGERADSAGCQTSVDA